MLRPGYAPFLCLLGDVCSPYSRKGAEFLTWCSRNWDHVLWVPGYHELNYNTDTGSTTAIERLTNLTDAAKNYRNITMMTNRTWTHPTLLNTVVIGTPLFTRFQKDPSTGRCHGIHDPLIQQHIRWLESHVAEADEMGEKAVVLTYSPPSPSLLNGDDADPKIPMYDLTELLLKRPICAWMMGDTVNNYRLLYRLTNLSRKTDYPRIILANSMQNVMSTTYMPHVHLSIGSQSTREN
jgi:hypothetical protein